jgi:pentatricopeptide repeat protein
MLASGCEPNDVTWTAAIDAFGRVGNWRAAEACFAGQLDRRRLPDAVSCFDAMSFHKKGPFCCSHLTRLLYRE